MLSPRRSLIPRRGLVEERVRSLTRLRRASGASSSDESVGEMPIKDGYFEARELPVRRKSWAHVKCGDFHRGSERPGCFKTKCGKMDTTDDKVIKLFEWPRLSWPRCRCCCAR